MSACSSKEDITENINNTDNNSNNTQNNVNNTSQNNNTNDTPSKEDAELRDILCDYIASNWAGIELRYKNTDNFLSECDIIDYGSDMELIQDLRTLIPDGHFYIGLNDTHKENRFSKAKIIPLTLTYDLYDNAVIAKSIDKLREIGLREGNIILKINQTEVRYYVEKLMELLPQSSYYESKEKAYRLLFTTTLKPFEDNYFEIPLFYGEDSLEITYLDTENGDISSVSVDFEPINTYLPADIISLSMNDYWSIQGYYNVSDKNTCLSDNEYASLKVINGKRWLIYHPFSFLYDSDTDRLIVESFRCYLKYIEYADYVILDLRDSVGGYFDPINIMLYLININATLNIYNKARINGDVVDYGKYTFTQKKVSGLPAVNNRIKIYIWTNSICGSAIDIFLRCIKNIESRPQVTIIGKPSAGRVQAMKKVDFLDFDVNMPFVSIFDDRGRQLEGKPILPDYYFDAKAEDYKSADALLKSYIDFIKEHNF